MSKVAEFLNKVAADEAAKAEFGAVIGVRKERELNDGDFQKIVELSEKLGASVTLDEVKDFFSGNGRELSDEELAGVAGGLYNYRASQTYYCPLCDDRICTVEVDFDHGRAMTADPERKNLKHKIVDHLICKHRDILGYNCEWEMAEKKAEEMIDQSWWEEFIDHWKAITAR